MRSLLLAVIIFLLTLHYERIQGILSSNSLAQENKQLLESGIPPSSKPKFSGEEYWMEEDQKLCDDPEEDKTWMKPDALCFMINRTGVLSKIEIISWSPLILLYKGMFSGQQVANYLRIFNQQKLEPQETVDSEGNPMNTKYRVADGVMTAEEDFPEARSLARTAAKHIPVFNFKNAEPVVGLSYQPGGHYTRHWDFLDFEEGVEEENVMNNGNRLATVIMVFQPAKLGGGTMFPLLFTTVRAEPGDAIVWMNMKKNGEKEELVEHAGCPVRAGKKVIATIWLRSKQQPLLENAVSDQASFHASALFL